MRDRWDPGSISLADVVRRRHENDEQNTAAIVIMPDVFGLTSFHGFLGHTRCARARPTSGV
jgi:hypothetical protein